MSTAPASASEATAATTQHQIINDISALQHQYTKLLSDLSTNTALTSDQQTKIINDIQNNSSLRSNLFSSMGNINSTFTNTLADAKSNLADKLIIVQIVERELVESQKKIEELHQEKINKMRLLQNTDYYGEQFQEKSKFMFVLALCVILGIIISILPIPSVVFNALLLIIICGGGYLLIRIGYSMWLRNNMDYQKYNFRFNPGAYATAISTSNSGDPWGSGSSTCIGQECCSETETYDPSLNRCVTYSGTGTQENYLNDPSGNSLLSALFSTTGTETFLNRLEGFDGF